MLESLLLSLAGGAGGIVLSGWLTQVLIKISVSIPRTSAIHLNWAVLFFAIGLTALAGILAGVIPAVTASKLDLNEAIHETSRSTIGSAKRMWSRNALVAGEIRMSFLLLVSAGLLLKSFVLLQTVDIGFKTDHVLTMNIGLTDAVYSSPAKIATFFEGLLDRVRTLPGVRSAGFVSVLPAAGHWMDTDFRIVGRPPLPKGQFNDELVRTADPGYFNTAGIPLIRGRFFTPSERLDKANVSIISQGFAHKYFPNEDPLGKYLDFWGKRRQIVGVVGDVRKGLTREPEPTMYAPMAEGFLGFGSLVVRTDNDPLALSLPIQRQIAELDPDLPVATILTMDQLISKNTVIQHFNTILLMAFAGLAVLLAAVGLYGVISYSTAQRTSEFGLRLALGAQPVDLIKSVLRQGLAPASLGILIGGAGAAASVRVLESMLFKVNPFDAAVFASVAIGLLLISLSACLVPALRAASIDPAQALRTD